jgi:CheY-like chemotaxis protein
MEKLKNYTTHDIATLCGVDPITVARWFDNGVLKGFRTPGGHRRVTQPELDLFLAQQGVEPKVDTPQIKVLIIDDDEDLLRLLRLQFQRLGGIEVSTCSSGIEGLLRVGCERPDVVLLDVYMDGLDGREVAKQLRVNPDLQSVQFAFMSGKLTPALKEELDALGPLMVFGKPIDAKVVASAILGGHIGLRE